MDIAGNNRRQLLFRSDCLLIHGEYMKSLFSRLFGILLAASLVLAACAPQAAQTVKENVQPLVTSTPEVMADKATVLVTEDVALPTVVDAVTPIPAVKVASAVQAEAALTSGVAFLEDLAPEKYDPPAFAKPATVTYTVSLTKPAPVIWSYVWCAADAKMLVANFENIQLRFMLDQKEVSADSFGTFETTTGGKVCRLIYTSLSDWTPGEHHLVTTATFAAKINDGSADYEPGDYILDYIVYVKP
jgi:hypothetical protein